MATTSHGIRNPSLSPPQTLCGLPAIVTTREAARWSKNSNYTTVYCGKRFLAKKKHTIIATKFFPGIDEVFFPARNRAAVPHHRRDEVFPLDHIATKFFPLSHRRIGFPHQIASSQKSNDNGHFFQYQYNRADQ